MSLIRIAIRVSAQQALLGRTLAGKYVHDSEMTAIEVNADGTLNIDPDARNPFILVFTDASTATDVELRNLRRTGALECVFETGISEAMTEGDALTDEKVVVGLGTPSTDAGFEATLDILEAQIVAALTDPDNDWAECWRKLISSVAKIERSRIARADDGVRRAARQVRLTVEAKPDPIYGEPLAETHPLRHFFRQAEVTLRVPNPAYLMPNPDYPASSDEPLIVDDTQTETIIDPDIAPILAAMKALIDGTGVVDEVAIIRRRHGHTESEARALGYALKSPYPITGYTIEGSHGPAA